MTTAAHGTLTNSVELPPDEQLTVPQEVTVPHMVFRAAAYHLGKYCEFQMKEFALCRAELKDPRKCLNEGAALTACGVEFFRKVQQNCKEQFNDYHYCIDHKGGQNNHLRCCRKPQRILDKCMLDKMNLERPPVGYFSRPHVHQSDRPQPEPFKWRDYKAEAAAYNEDIPADYPLKDEYKRYYSGVHSAFL